MADDRKKQDRHIKLKASIWVDDEFTALPAASQRLYVLILSQPAVTLCGVIQPAFKRWATFAPDTPAADIAAAARTLQERGFIDIDDDTDELLIRSFVRHGVALESENAIVGMSKAFDTIHSKVLRKVVIEELRKVAHEDLLKGLGRHVPELPADGQKPKPPISRPCFARVPTGLGRCSVRTFGRTLVTQQQLQHQQTTTATTPPPFTVPRTFKRTEPAS